MEIIVGRKGNQPFSITDKSVSSSHLKLTTLPDGNIQVEDLGSTNGTFIDDIRIIKKTVSADTVVRMGPKFTFRIKDALKAVPTPATNGKTPAANGTAPDAVDEETIKKFLQLEPVWQKYHQDKINLQRGNASKGFLRMMPLFLLGASGYLISCIPSLAEYRLLITFAGLAAGAIITWIAYKSTTDLPEKMEQLNQQMQIDYVCPKCKQFLGFTPFEGLKNKGQCTYCKSKWVKK